MTRTASPKKPAARARKGADSTPEAPQIQKRERIMTVAIPIQGQEREAAMTQLLGDLETVDILQTKKKASVADFNKKIDDVMVEIQETRKRLAKGVDQELELVEIKDFAAGMVTYTRQDNGEEITHLRREMTEADRQLELGGPEDEDDQADDGDFEDPEDA